MADKLDLLKLHKADYASPKKPVMLDIAPARYLAIDGRGAPGGDEFQTALGALYGMAFTLKMTRKFGGGQDYAVCKLEAQWTDTGDGTAPRNEWCWKMMIRTPEFVEPAELKLAAARLSEKGKGEGAERVELLSIEEGRCVQVLHVGPYEDEGRSIEGLRVFAAEQGHEFHGHHHEIYLSDPRRVPPERLRTILRQPVRPRG